MLEKIITLENISLVDFLGVENQNIKLLATVFPESKIISRGDEIRIIGTAPQILKISEILNLLLSHYHEYGKVTNENVKDFVDNEENTINGEGAAKVLVHGTCGIRITPKTINQKKLVQAVEKNDLVFAIGPAGTGKTYISVALAVKALKSKE
ncbi:MAG: PhoH family protein, partial [Ekhidna sp.]|nr:PhoH family protein [Ekhidna sp.]